MSAGKLVNQLVTPPYGICNASPFFSWPLDFPLAAFLNQLQLASSPPPPIEFAGQRRPNLLAFNQVAQVAEQGLIYFSGS